MRKSCMHLWIVARRVEVGIGVIIASEDSFVAEKQHWSESQCFKRRSKPNQIRTSVENTPIGNHSPGLAMLGLLLMPGSALVRRETAALGPVRTADYQNGAQLDQIKPIPKRL